MSNTSKLLVVVPVLFSLLFVGADVVFDFEVQEYHVQLIEIVTGGTIIAGTANAGFKRYVANRDKNNFEGLRNIAKEIQQTVTEVEKIGTPSKEKNDN